ncbi:MAG: RNA polymerase sigma-70 factor [Prevotella sp.]|jgi:RNA polymerase sigma-70 factor (family 1)
MDIELLFNQYYRALCLYALHYLGNCPEDAEDVVQESYVKLWSNQPSQPKSFLYTTVRNACIDRLRTRNNNMVVDTEPHDEDGIIDDEEAQSRSEREARLWQAIDNLPERCRQIFLMSKRDGMTYKQIASELGLSEKTVEHQVSKALSRLRGSKEDIYFVLLFY